MVDLSKHLARAKQAIERRNYDLAIEITLDCQEVDSANLDNYRLLLEAAKRRAREGGKKGFTMRLPGLSKDPHKQLTGMVKFAAKNPDLKALLMAGDAAKKVFDSGVKSMLDVALLFYAEAKATGMFSKELLWNQGHASMERFNISKDPEDLENALKAMAELHQNDKSHGEAARTLKNWEAKRAMARRNEGGEAGDYRGQLASSAEAQRNEIMNRIIRTAEDAKAVLDFIENDLQSNPDDKALIMKKGDVLRRVGKYAEAKQAYDQAAAIDPHDFVITMRQGDVVIQAKEAQIKAAQQGGQDVSAAVAELTTFKIEHYRERVSRQPTEMTHRYNLGELLFKTGDVDGAAAEFQASVKDPRYKKASYNYLGHCFAKKGLLDLALKQFTEALNLIEDKLSADYKEGLYNRGRINEAQGNAEAAISDYTQVVELDLGYKDAADRLGKLKGG